VRKSKNTLALQSQTWIFTSLAILLNSIPYESITVCMICKKAGVDRSTFYRYFDNKQDVLYSYIDRIFDEYKECIIRLNSIKPVEIVRLFFDFWCINYKDFIYALQRNELLHMAFMKKNKNILEIHGLMDKKLGRNSNKYEASYRVGGLINVLYSWIDNNFKENSKEIAVIIAKILK